MTWFKRKITRIVSEYISTNEYDVDRNEYRQLQDRYHQMWYEHNLLLKHLGLEIVKIQPDYIIREIKK